MIKKATLLFIFSIFMMTLFGCETTKGALMGGIEGAKKDWETTKGVGAALMRADEWIQKNIW